MKNLSSIILIALSFLTTESNAQQVIFSDNFERQIIDSAYWTTVSGAWKIAHVDEMRIAPAEKGFRTVLCADGKGEKLIRLIVDLPDSIRRGSLMLSFYYYMVDPSSKVSFEVEFYEKEIKDGLRGKPISISLPVYNGRWIEFRKKFTIPLKASSFRLVLTGSDKEKKVCFDVFQVKAFR